MRRTFVLLVLASSLACSEKEADSPVSEGRKRSDEASPPGALTAALTAEPQPVAGRPGKENKRRPKSILLAEARELIGWRVADGYLSRDEIVELAMASADERESLRGEVVKLVDEELLAHKRREKEWKFLTDPDRLTRAFEGLERQGILARERFADCRKCAVADIRSERELSIEHGKSPTGYVFFTEQDADDVSDHGELVLEFGSFRDDPAAHQRVAEKVKEALSKEGLTVVEEESDEGGEAYLVLTELNWQKRRFTKAPR